MIFPQITNSYFVAFQKYSETSEFAKVVKVTGKKYHTSETKRCTVKTAPGKILEHGTKGGHKRSKEPIRSYPAAAPLYVEPHCRPPALTTCDPGPRIAGSANKEHWP